MSLNPSLKKSSLNVNDVGSSTLSVVIITYNAGTTIKKTLESVSFADEIIIVDSGSTDDTLKVAAAYTDKIYHQDWLGFGRQKNLALSYAQGDWVLSLDADEWLSDGLKKEVKSVVNETEIELFSIPIKLFFLNKIIRYANGSNKAFRLFRRGKAFFTEDAVHEKLIGTNKIGELKNSIIHHSFNDISHLVDKLNQYSSLSAEAKQKKGKKGGIFRGLYHKAWLFFRIYFLNLGFLDGTAGFILSREFSNASYYRYLKVAYQLKDKRTRI